VTYDQLLTDRCRVVRRAGGTFNDTTGNYGPPTDTEFYNGVCRVESLSGQSANRVVVGDEAVVAKGYRVFLPFTETDPKVEDVVIVTTSEDAQMVGRELVVMEAGAAASPLSDMSVRWLVCESHQEGP
jgi:hypothetical protein